MKRSIFNYLALMALSSCGIFVEGFAGGIVTGFFCGIVFIAVVGKRAAMKAGKRIDKSMKDFIYQQEIDKDAN